MRVSVLAVGLGLFSLAGAACGHDDPPPTVPTQPLTWTNRATALRFAREGARLIVVNAEPTPYDDLADEVVLTDDDLADFGDSLRDDVNAVGPHIGDQPHAALTRHVDTFIETLGRHIVAGGHHLTMSFVYNGPTAATAPGFWDALGREYKIGYHSREEAEDARNKLVSALEQYVADKTHW